MAARKGLEGNLDKIEQRILDDIRQQVNEILPSVQDAIVATDGLEPASIAVAIKWKPNEETSELELSVHAKATLPTTSTQVKNAVRNGQLVLL